MFRRSHDNHFKDLSRELRDTVDWDVKSLTSFQYLDSISAVAVEPVSSLLAVGTAQGEIHLFGRPGVECVLHVPDSAGVKLLHFAASVYALLCTDSRHRLHLWDLLEYGRPKLISSVRCDPVASLTTSPSHTHAFIALESGRLLTYDLICHRMSPYVLPDLWKLYLEKIPDVPKDDPLSHIPVDIVIHPRDLNLVFVAYSGGIILSDLTQRSTVGVYEYAPPDRKGVAAHSHPDLPKHLVTAFAVHPAGHCFAVGYSDGAIAFWATEDQGEPILVRYLESNLEQNRPLHGQLEPVFKLAWSGYPEPSDRVQSGQTTLTVLGGLQEGSLGLTVELLPQYIAPEAVTSPDPHSRGANPLLRKAIHDSVMPLQSHFYECGFTQDFVLLPRESPHFSGNHDPHLLLIVVETPDRKRVLQAHQFPPPSFAPVPNKEPAPVGSEAPENLADQLADMLDELKVDAGPTPISLPLKLSATPTGLVDGSMFILDGTMYDKIAGEPTVHTPDAFPFKGGFAWSDESHASGIRLAKYQPRRLLVTRHKNLTVQFHDISAQLLIGLRPNPICTFFPNRLLDLTIDLNTVTTDAAVAEHLPPSESENAFIASVYISADTLETLVQLSTGHLFVFRLRRNNTPPRRDVSDSEIIMLDHGASSDDSRYSPFFMFDCGKGLVTCCSISDIGFVAAAYMDGSLYIVDMRGPKVILRYGGNMKKHKLLHRQSDEIDFIVSIAWTVTSLPNDPHVRIRLFANHISGTCNIFTIQYAPDTKAFSAQNSPTTLETVHHCLADGIFVLDANNGVHIKANGSNFAATLQDHATPTEDSRHSLLVVAGSKEVRCFGDFDEHSRLGKAEWSSKYGEVELVKIVQKGSSHALVAVTRKHIVLVYSIPKLELLHVLQLPPEASSRVSIDDSGDYISWAIDGKSGIAESSSYGTLFGLQRAHYSADIDLQSSRPIIPPQPQPISAGPLAALGSWFGITKNLTGAQIDALLAGPDRPLPTPAPTLNTPSALSGVDTTGFVSSVTGMKSGLYDRLQAAVGERGQMLSDLEESFNSLQAGSQNMVSEAKRLAAEQGGKRWMGL